MKRAEDRSAPCKKATLSVVPPSTPETVTNAVPKSADAKNVTPPVVSSCANTVDVLTLLRSNARLSCMLCITRVPEPDAFSEPEFTSPASISTCSLASITSSFGAVASKRPVTVDDAAIPPRTKEATASETSTITSPVAVPPNDTEPASFSMTTNVEVGEPPPQAASGSSRKGTSAFLFLRTPFLAHSARSFARAAGSFGSLISSISTRPEETKALRSSSLSATNTEARSTPLKVAPRNERDKSSIDAALTT